MEALESTLPLLFQLQPPTHSPPPPYHKSSWFLSAFFFLFQVHAFFPESTHHRDIIHHPTWHNPYLAYLQALQHYPHPSHGTHSYPLTHHQILGDLFVDVKTDTNTPPLKHTFPLTQWPNNTYKTEVPWDLLPYIKIYWRVALAEVQSWGSVVGLGAFLLRH